MVRPSGETANFCLFLYRHFKQLGKPGNGLKKNDVFLLLVRTCRVLLLPAEPHLNELVSRDHGHLARVRNDVIMRQAHSLGCFETLIMCLIGHAVVNPTRGQTSRFLDAKMRERGVRFRRAQKPALYKVKTAIVDLAGIEGRCLLPPSVPIISGL